MGLWSSCVRLAGAIRHLGCLYTETSSFWNCRSASKSHNGLCKMEGSDVNACGGKMVSYAKQGRFKCGQINTDIFRHRLSIVLSLVLAFTACFAIVGFYTQRRNFSSVCKISRTLAEDPKIRNAISLAQNHPSAAKSHPYLPLLLKLSIRALPTSVVIFLDQRPKWLSHSETTSRRNGDGLNDQSWPTGKAAKR